MTIQYFYAVLYVMWGEIRLSLQGGGWGTGVGLHERVTAETEGFTKSVGTLSPEQNGGHAQPGRVGYEGKAVLRRH